MTPLRIVLAALLALVLPAAAQNSDREPREAIAREIIRLATVDLRAGSTPTPQDYAAALILFDFARELDPENTEIIRRQIEAAHNCGDPAAVLRHTSALVLRDKSDTVATIRLITGIINRDFSTAEARLAAYDKVLTDTRYDVSIRSRLALDAALLLRERGDDKGFKDKLVLALHLDPSHKEAAALAATFFAERVKDDAPGRVDLLINLLMADPIDPNIHLSISREMAAVGAFAAAKRFHTNSLNIASLLSRTGDQAVVENRVLTWCAQSPAEVVKEFAESLAAERDEAARRIRKLIAAGKPADDAPKPEDIFLPGPLSTMYVLAADASDDAVARSGGMRDLTTQVEKLVEKLKSPRTRGTLTEQAAAMTSIEAMIQLNTLRLWLDLDTVRYNQNPEVLTAIRKAFPDAGELLDAMWELRAGRPQEAIDRCAPLLPGRMARIATALAYEQLGNREAAIQHYRDVIKAEPLQPAAAWSRSRIAKLGGHVDSPQAAEFERLVADPRVPAWIDQMTLDPNRFIRLTVRATSTESEATAFQPIRITLTNQSPIPLALGSDRPLSSRFLLVPKMDDPELERFLRPEVIDLDRRLRLAPRESISVDVWPGPGQSGWLLDGIANRSVRVRWRLTQGFLPSESGGFRPGPMCLSAESEAVVLKPLASSSLAPAELATAIANAPLDSLHRLACVTRSIVLQPLLKPDPLPPPPPAPKRGELPQPPIVVPPPDLKPAASALTLRYPTLSPAMRAMLLAIVPHARLAPDLAALDAVARTDEDPLARAIFLITRVTDATDEALAAALKSEDPRLRGIARSVEGRIAARTLVYARFTADDIRGSKTQPPAPDAAPAIPPAPANPPAAAPGTPAPAESPR